MLGHTQFWRLPRSIFYFTQLVCFVLICLFRSLISLCVNCALLGSALTLSTLLSLHIALLGILLLYPSQLSLLCFSALHVLAALPILHSCLILLPFLPCAALLLGLALFFFPVIYATLLAVLLPSPFSILSDFRFTEECDER